MLLRIDMHKQKSSNCLFTRRRRLLLPCPKWHRFVPGSWRLRPCYPLVLETDTDTRVSEDADKHTRPTTSRNKQLTRFVERDLGL